MMRNCKVGQYNSKYMGFRIFYLDFFVKGGIHLTQAPPLHVVSWVMETFPGPIAGIDYPRNLQEFDRWFANELACRSYVFRIRWPKGYQLPL